MTSAIHKLDQYLEDQTTTLVEQGLYKDERSIASPQGGTVKLSDDRSVLNFCANNYLGLANHPDLRQAASQALEEFGYGMASVRFICGTQTQHKQLERQLAQFIGFDDCILYASCFDANAGLFETLLDERDAIISDALNHASIIDGVRLCKAKRLRYRNNDMDDLREQLEQCSDARFRMIATDGVFSMDGSIANLAAICDLAGEYDAMVMVDDSHATGFVGENGRGTIEHCKVQGRVDILTSTLGKALGGASGGFTLASKQVVDWLRQRSRPYLFSNSVSPQVVAASLAALLLVQQGYQLRARLARNAKRFRQGLEEAGFTLLPGQHPIIPVMLGDAELAQRMAARLLELGVYVVGFSFPVVPKGQARIRTQMTAAHTDQDIDRAIAAFVQAGQELELTGDGTST